MKPEFKWDRTEETLDAIAETKLGGLRAAGMRARYAVSPPTAAIGRFPYAGRTCAEWSEEEAANA